MHILQMAVSPTRLDADASANDSPLGIIRMWSCSLLTRALVQKTSRNEFKLIWTFDQNCKSSRRRCDAAVTYCDVRAGKSCPAEQVNQSVQAGQFTACHLFTFNQRGRFHSIQVINRSHHPQTYTEKQTWSQNVMQKIQGILSVFLVLSVLYCVFIWYRMDSSRKSSSAN